MSKEAVQEATSAGARVAAWTVVSRATGLVRIAMVAAVLGPTYFGNLYQSANLIPNITYEFLTGPLFASMLVPVVVKYLDRGDSVAIQRIVGQFLGWVLLLFLLVSVSIIAFGPQVIQLLNLGNDNHEVVTQLSSLGWLLLSLFMPQLLFYGLIGASVAIQQAHGRFFLAAAAPSIENLGIVATLVTYQLRFGAGNSLAEISLQQILWLGLGTTGSVGMHALVQWLGAKGAGVTLIPKIQFKLDSEVRGIVRLAVPSLGYAFLNAARLIAILIVASSIPGGVVAFQLAFNFYTLADALIARPVAQGNLPALSRAAINGDSALYGRLLTSATSLFLVFAIPAAAAYGILSSEIAGAVSHGQMDDRGARLMSDALLGLSPGVIGAVALVVATHAFYARREAKLPVMFVAGRSLVATSLLLALVALDSVDMLNLGLVVGLTDVCFALGIYSVLLAKHLRGNVRSIGKSLARALLAVTAMALFLVGFQQLSGAGNSLPGLIYLTILSAAGLVIYLVVLRLLKSPELQSLVGALRTRGGRLG